MGRIVLTGALVVLASACGSDRLTAAEYFPAVEQLARDFRTELERLDGEFNTGVEAIDFESPTAERDLISLFQTQLIGTSAAFEEFHTELALLDPPEKLTDAHEDAVAAAVNVSGVFAERRSSLDELGSLEELDEFAADPAFGDARGRFTESCFELEALADLEGIAIDLPC